MTPVSFGHSNIFPSLKISSLVIAQPSHINQNAHLGEKLCCFTLHLIAHQPSSKFDLGLISVSIGTSCDKDNEILCNWPMTYSNRLSVQILYWLTMSCLDLIWIPSRDWGYTSLGESAVPRHHAQGHGSKLLDHTLEKNYINFMSLLSDIKLISTYTTLDLGQKAAKDVFQQSQPALTIPWIWLCKTQPIWGGHVQMSKRMAAHHSTDQEVQWHRHSSCCIFICRVQPFKPLIMAHEIWPSVVLEIARMSWALCPKRLSSFCWPSSLYIFSSVTEVHA